MRQLDELHQDESNVALLDLKKQINSETSEKIDYSLYHMMWVNLFNSIAQINNLTPLEPSQKTIRWASFELKDWIIVEALEIVSHVEWKNVWQEVTSYYFYTPEITGWDKKDMNTLSHDRFYELFANSSTSTYLPKYSEYPSKILSTRKIPVNILESV